MKRLVANTMSLVYTHEDAPDVIKKSIFLAGPTPRDYEKKKSWRKEAVEILESLGYDGVVYLPEYRDGKAIAEEDFDLSKQVEWEHKHLKSCDAIIFWIPREMRPDFEFAALTTNIEFGLFFNSYKLFVGSPKEAKKNEYLKEISKDRYAWHDDLRSLMEDVVAYLGDGIERRDTERLVPKHIFESAQFQNWYQPQIGIGNKMVGYDTLFEAHMKSNNKMFMCVFHPDMYVKESMDGHKEDRVKNNEFVIARTDMSYVLAYQHNEQDILDSKIVLVEEYRVPIVNEPEMVVELAGGSSMKDNEDRLQTAADELKEETGIIVEKDRLVYHGTKQSASTLCSHRIALYSVELTDEEIEKAVNDNTVHGVVEDTERTYVHVMTVREAMKYVDWTNIGMIMNVLEQG